MFLWFITLLVLYATADDTDIDNHPSWKYMSRTECGKTRLDNSRARIMGGKMASLGEFPWMVRVGYLQYALLEPGFVCGGSLISTLHVLTAGHCDKKNNIVRVGKNNVKTDPNCEKDECALPPQDIHIKKHLLDIFNKTTEKDDIGLIYLEKAVTLNEFVVPICLPYGDLLREDMMGRYMTIAGWGVKKSFDTTTSKDLMRVVEPVVDQSLCNAIYTHPLSDKQYCIGLSDGKDSCSGDSGDPVIISMKVNAVRQMYQYGIVSFGLPDCGKGPAVYTAVVKYMKQILDGMEYSE